MRSRHGPSAGRSPRRRPRRACGRRKPSLARPSSSRNEARVELAARHEQVSAAAAADGRAGAGQPLARRGNRPDNARRSAPRRSCSTRPTYKSARGVSVAGRRGATQQPRRVSRSREGVVRWLAERGRVCNWSRATRRSTRWSADRRHAAKVETGSRMSERERLQTSPG